MGEAVIEAAAKRDHVVTDIVDIGFEASGHKQLMRGEVDDAPAVEQLAVGSEAAAIVVAEIAPPDLIGALGEVVVGNQRIRVGVADLMEVGLDAVVAEDVVVGVEAEAADVVGDVIGVRPDESATDLKIGESGGGRYRDLTTSGSGGQGDTQADGEGRYAAIKRLRGGSNRAREVSL